MIDIWKEITEKAPKEGQYLAYTREAVFFKTYEELEDVKTDLSGKELLELHLFDDDEEFRFLLTTAHKSKNAFLTKVITNKDIPDENATNCFAEEVILDLNDTDETHNMTTRLWILNHVSYDENGMAYIDNYRLKLGGTEE